MAKPRKSASRRSKPDAAPPQSDWVTFPALLTLVAGVVVLGAFFYSAVLAVFSAIFASFVGWLWWQRRHAQPVTTPTQRRKTPARRKSRRPRA